MIERDSPTGAALVWLIAITVAYLSARILVPVAGAVAVAAIAALAAYPLHKRIAKFAPKYRTATAFATTIIICLLIGGPLATASWFVAREAAHAYLTTREFLAGRGNVSWNLPGYFADSAPDMSGFDLQNILIDNLNAIAAPATRAVGTVLRNLGAMAIGFIVFLSTMVLFLRDGPAIVRALERLLPLSADRKITLRAKLVSAVDAAVQGVFLIALIQGAFAALGFALFRVPFAAFLGMLCAVLSPLPFIGSALIWVPVVARIALEGRPVRAVLLGAWFVLIVGLSDNVARPFLLRAKMRVPLPVIIVGVFGGIGAFGISGAFFGPIIAAIALAMLEAFGESSGSNEPEPTSAK